VKPDFLPSGLDLGASLTGVADAGPRFEYLEFFREDLAALNTLGGDGWRVICATFDSGDKWTSEGWTGLAIRTLP